LPPAVTLTAATPASRRVQSQAQEAG
jgi:hypothetical protein